MRWGSSVIPVHLVSFSLQPNTPLSRLVLFFMSSSFCLCCTHTFTTVLALILFAPLGGACVCNLWSHVGVCLSFFKQGAEGSPVVASANEAPLWMIRKTYLLGAPGRIVRRSWWPPFPFLFCRCARTVVRLSRLRSSSSWALEVPWKVRQLPPN